jgi:hypothetical protein|mmetsp:Transcript_74496/g.125543  ORF Transcript_74496/g.125543 Transcript_74496/m.125543 type:complete len:81 (+) Transcript_74496:1677-1919(+)
MRAAVQVFLVLGLLIGCPKGVVVVAIAVARAHVRFLNCGLMLVCASGSAYDSPSFVNTAQGKAAQVHFIGIFLYQNWLRV